MHAQTSRLRGDDRGGLSANFLSTYYITSHAHVYMQKPADCVAMTGGVCQNSALQSDFVYKIEFCENNYTAVADRGGLSAVSGYQNGFLFLVDNQLFDFLEPLTRFKLFFGIYFISAIDRGGLSPPILTPSVYHKDRHPPYAGSN